SLGFYRCITGALHGARARLFGARHGRRWQDRGQIGQAIARPSRPMQRGTILGYPKVCRVEVVGLVFFLLSGLFSCPSFPVAF
ncbi:MAG: hypothetical protein KA914_16605, partial [Ottowia sp.]|nr:hypothetical protein [Ottowia sp.]